MDQARNFGERFNASRTSSLSVAALPTWAIAVSTNDCASDFLKPIPTSARIAVSIMLGGCVSFAGSGVGSMRSNFASPFSIVSRSFPSWIAV